MITAYGSIVLMNTYTGYLVILITAGCGYSALKTGLDTWINSEDISVVWVKTKKKVIATIIGITITATITFLKKYY